MEKFVDIQTGKVLLFFFYEFTYPKTSSFIYFFKVLIWHTLSMCF